MGVPHMAQGGRMEGTLRNQMQAIVFLTCTVISGRLVPWRASGGGVRRGQGGAEMRSQTRLRGERRGRREKRGGRGRREGEERERRWRGEERGGEGKEEERRGGRRTTEVL
eukprot:3410939-Rhodomonas_salina.1